MSESRIESILQAGIDGEEFTGDTLSRVEGLLKVLVESTVKAGGLKKNDRSIYRFY